MGKKSMQNEITITSNQLITDKKKVPYTFNKIASRYDIATHFSQGYSKDLERSVKLLQLKGNEYILDLCCGTGKSTKYCLDAVPEGKVLAIDNSSGMLEVAKKTFSREIEQGKCRFVEQDVMNLNEPDNSVDAIFMAYGIRNMPDYDKCLRNLLRMLKPGGTIAFHEFSLKSGFVYRFLWKILGYGFIVPFSTILTGNMTIFTYLIKSVLNFPSPQQFRLMLTETGFESVEFYPQPSWRRFNLHTFIAKKPFMSH